MAEIWRQVLFYCYFPPYYLDDRRLTVAERFLANIFGFPSNSCSLTVPFQIRQHERKNFFNKGLVERENDKIADSVDKNKTKLAVKKIYKTQQRLFKTFLHEKLSLKKRQKKHNKKNIIKIINKKQSSFQSPKWNLHSHNSVTFQFSDSIVETKKKKGFRTRELARNAILNNNIIATFNYK